MFSLIVFNVKDITDRNYMQFCRLGPLLSKFKDLAKNESQLQSIAPMMKEENEAFKAFITPAMLYIVLEMTGVKDRVPKTKDFITKETMKSFRIQQVTGETPEECMDKANIPPDSLFFLVEHIFSENLLTALAPKTLSLVTGKYVADLTARVFMDASPFSDAFNEVMIQQEGEDGLGFTFLSGGAGSKDDFDELIENIKMTAFGDNHVDLRGASASSYKN